MNEQKAVLEVTLSHLICGAVRADLITKLSANRNMGNHSANKVARNNAIHLMSNTIDLVKSLRWQAKALFYPA